MEESIYLQKIVKEVLSLAGDHFLVRTIGQVRFNRVSYPIFVIENRIKNPENKNILISAGLHGNEPGSVYAVIKFLKKRGKKLSKKFNLYISPCLNPTGLDMECRYNFKGKDLNRDFQKAMTREVALFKNYLKANRKKYSLALDMHEDNTFDVVEGFTMRDNPRGLYFYEVYKDRRSSDFGKKMVSILRREGFPITRKRAVYDEICRGGIIFSSGANHPRYTDHNTFEGFVQKYTDRAITSESPTHFSFKQRINNHFNILQAALAAVEDD